MNWRERLAGVFLIGPLLKTLADVLTITQIREDLRRTDQVLANELRDRSAEIAALRTEIADMRSRSETLDSISEGRASSPDLWLMISSLKSEVGHIKRTVLTQEQAAAHKEQSGRAVHEFQTVKADFGRVLDQISRLTSETAEIRRTFDEVGFDSLRNMVSSLAHALREVRHSEGRILAEVRRVTELHTADTADWTQLRAELARLNALGEEAAKTAHAVEAHMGVLTGTVQSLSGRVDWTEKRVLPMEALSYEIHSLRSELQRVREHAQAVRLNSSGAATPASGGY